MNETRELKNTVKSPRIGIIIAELHMPEAKAHFFHSIQHQVMRQNVLDRLQFILDAN
jgi:hypothetical protein